METMSTLMQWSGTFPYGALFRTERYLIETTEARRTIKGRVRACRRGLFARMRRQDYYDTESAVVTELQAALHEADFQFENRDEYEVVTAPTSRYPTVEAFKRAFHSATEPILGGRVTLEVKLELRELPKAHRRSFL